MESCSSKFVAGNEKMIATFVEIQQRKNKEAAEEAEKLAAKQIETGTNIETKTET